MSNSSPLYLLEEKEQNENKDRLSKLPDDILVSIISLVDRKDATRTSILSRRWRYMATYFTSMDFDVSHTWLKEYLGQHKSLKNEKQRFMNWVDQVVTLHRAPFINDFRISLPFDATYSNHINIWIQFAISKRVKKLELDFGYGTFCSLGRYSLPFNVFKGSPFESGISYLTSICFKCVDISAEVLELLLSRCHLLERLYIERANKLSNVKILSEKLKYLAIHHCVSLNKVEIHAVSLQSLEFSAFTERGNVVYDSVPSLVEARFWWRYGDGLLPDFYSILLLNRRNSLVPDFLQTRDGLVSNFLQTKCFSAQLSKLSLDINMVISEDPIIPSFPNVKYLELRVLVDSHRNLLPLMCFAESCPLLHEFKLQLTWRYCGCKKVPSNSESQSENESDSEMENDSNSENELDSDLETENNSNSESEECNLGYVKHWLETQEGTNATLPNLRKLEWSGAFSVHGDLEIALALYCVKNAIILEKFICDPRYLPSKFGKPSDIAEVVKGRRRARRLAVVIPSHIEYVIV